MKVHYIKGLGMIEENESNMSLLIAKGLVEEPKKEIKQAKVVVYDTIVEEPSEQDSGNTKRTRKSKPTE